MDKKLIKNIYRIYQYNTLKFNFFVKKYTWLNYVAKVKVIDKVIEGEKILGKYPYYDNPNVIVDLYQIIDNSKNNILKIKKIKSNILVDTAGNYSWILIDKVNFIEVQN
jgi:hypothetical protein